MADNGGGSQTEFYVAPDGSQWASEADYQAYLNGADSPSNLGSAQGGNGVSVDSSGNPIPLTPAELAAFNKEKYDDYIASGGDPRAVNPNFSTSTSLGSSMIMPGSNVGGVDPTRPNPTNSYLSGNLYGSGSTGKQYAPYDLGNGKTKWDEIVATLQNQKDLETQRAQNNIDVENLRGLSAKQIEDIRAAEQRHQVDTGSANEFLKELMAERGPKDPYSYLFNSRGMMTPRGYAPAPLPMTDGIMQAYKNAGITDMGQIQKYLTGGNEPSLSQWGVLGSMPASLDSSSSPYGQVVGNAQYGTPEMQIQQNAGNPVGTQGPPVPQAQQGLAQFDPNAQPHPYQSQPRQGSAQFDPNAQPPPYQGQPLQVGTPPQNEAQPQYPQFQVGYGAQLPKFDNGGQVPGQQGSPVLAVVHAGETIRNPRQEALLQQGIREPLPVQPGQTHFADGGVVAPLQIGAGITYQHSGVPQYQTQYNNENRGPGYPGNHGQPAPFWNDGNIPKGGGSSVTRDASGNIVRVYDGNTGHVYDGNGNLVGTVANHGGGTYQDNAPIVNPSAVAPPGTPNATNSKPTYTPPQQGSIAGNPFPNPVGTPAPGSSSSTTGPTVPPAPPAPPPVAPIGTQTAPPTVPGSGGKPPFDLNKLDPYTRALVDNNGRPIPPSAQQWKDMPTSAHDAFQNYSETVAGVNFNDLMDTAKNLYPVAGAPLATGFK